MDSLRGSFVKLGTILGILAWPLRKDDTHNSRSVNNLDPAQDSRHRGKVQGSVSKKNTKRPPGAARRPRPGRTWCPACPGCEGWTGACPKKMFTLLDLCVSSLRRGHANLLCIVPILTDDPRRKSIRTINRSLLLLLLLLLYMLSYTYIHIYIYVILLSLFFVY